MKNSGMIFKASKFILIALFAFSQISFAQNATTLQPVKALTTAELVSNRSFTFVPSTALPVSGSARQLNPYYILKISKDTVVSDLP